MNSLANRRHPFAMLAVGALISSNTLSVAHAEESLTLEEIVVTAQKRAENAQDVPIAITALSAAALEEKGVTNVADVSNFTPNIQIDRASPFAGSSTIMSAYIRGIGQNDFAFNMEPGVGLYVDGVYYARTVGAALDLLDVERVEVLKGPQGTLFGRNTIGGAISVITRKPNGEFGFQGDLTVGNFNRQSARGSINLPLVDGLLYSSVSFSSTQRDGFQKRIGFDPTQVAAINPISGLPYANSTYTSDDAQFVRAKSNYSGSDRQGGQNSRTARAKLLFTPSDDVEFLLTADLTNAHEESTPITLLKTYVGAPFGLTYNACIAGIDPSGIAPPGALPPGMCDVPRGTVGTSLSDIAATALPYGDHFITNDIDTTYATGSNFSDVRTYGFGGTLDWQFNDNLSLKSITAYRNLDSRFGVDMDGSPIIALDTSFTMVQSQWSEELQLNINAFDERLKSVVGMYYFKEDGGLLDTVNFAGGLLQVYGPNDFENKALAAFTHNNLQLTDQFGLTVGLRYTKETKYFTGGQSDLNGFVARFLGAPPVVFPDQTNTNLLFPTGRNKQDFTNTSMRVGAEYKFTPDMMGYASFAQGYKSGGWTTRLAAPLAISVGAGAPIDPTVPPAFKPEKADTIEVGLKSELLDRRLRLNTALFHTSYKDMQIVSAPGFTLGAPWFFNAGKARIQGLEVEADAKLTASFVMNAAVGYLDAKYTELGALALAGGITKDSKLLNVPKWSTNVGGTYTVGIGADRELAVHADYIYKSDMARDTLNTPELTTQAFSLVNANVTYGSLEGNWQLNLGVDNLTDERYIVSGNNNPGVGAISATYNAPRTWTVGVKFRH